MGSEIHFIVHEADEGGYLANSVGHDIFTEADDLKSLHQMVKDAVTCHFEPEQKPSIIHLHITKEEIFAA